jgi:hypothetical protein
MTALSLEAPGACGEPIDVLTLGEESVLKSVREIVSGIRAKSRAIGVEDVVTEVISIGGTVSTEADKGGFKIYELRGARFSLTADSGPGKAIQLSFIPAVR